MGSKIFSALKQFLMGVALFGVATFTSCYAGWPCEEPVFAGLGMVSIEFRKDGVDLFSPGSGYYRDSLVIMNIETGKKVTGDLYNIQDPDGYDYDARARNEEVCPSYSVQFKKGDIDTLRICYQIKYDKKDCGSEFSSLNFFWNGGEATHDDIDWARVVIEKK